MTDTDKQFLLKKLLYLSKNRGWRENDILLGKFSESGLDNFSLTNLINYQDFLNETDPDIFYWITKKIELPLKYKTNIIYELIDFNKL